MTFEFDGKAYQRASSHQQEWGAKLVAELQLQGCESVLDLGCGDGSVTERIADAVPKGQVVGIDASKGMLEAARPKARENLQFLLCDIDDLRFEDQFDVVFSNATLHWVKDHVRLLSSTRVALRASGRVRFNFAGDGNCSNFFRVVKSVMSHSDFAADFIDFRWPWYMPSVEKYAALAESSGFREVRTWGENADRAFPTAEAMIDWIDQPSIVPFLASLPSGKIRAFRDAVVRRMLDETRQPDGSHFEKFRRVNISATK